MNVTSTAAPPSRLLLVRLRLDRAVAKPTLANFSAALAEVVAKCRARSDSPLVRPSQTLLPSLAGRRPGTLP